MVEVRAPRLIQNFASHQHIKTTTRFLLSLIISIIIVFSTLNFPKTINEHNQLNRITCGYPYIFITYTSYKAFPDYAETKACIGWMGNPMETPKKILWEAFFINVTIVLGAIWGGIYLIQKLYRNKK